MQDDADFHCRIRSFMVPVPAELEVEPRDKPMSDATACALPVSKNKPHCSKNRGFISTLKLPSLTVVLPRPR